MHKQTISAYERRAEGLEGDNEALQRPNTAESQTGGLCWRPKPSVRVADAEAASDPDRKEKFIVLFLYCSSPIQCPP